MSSISHASALRLAHALPLAFGLAFIWPEAADAGRYGPPAADAAPSDHSQPASGSGSGSTQR